MKIGSVSKAEVRGGGNAFCYDATPNRLIPQSNTHCPKGGGQGQMPSRWSLWTIGLINRRADVSRRALPFSNYIHRKRRRKPGQEASWRFIKKKKSSAREKTEEIAGSQEEDGTRGGYSMGGVQAVFRKLSAVLGLGS